MEEVDHEDVKLRLFPQSLYGEVKKWFRTHPYGNINTFQQFEEDFLRRWEDRKNPLQVLTRYNNLKISSDESMQGFSTTFMQVYNSNLAQVKPPPRASEIHYVDVFDSDFALLLRERIYATLTDMKNDAKEVEVNLMALGNVKHKIESEKKKIKEENQLLKVKIYGNNC